MNNLVETFKVKKCVAIKNFVDVSTIKIISRYLQNKIICGDWNEKVSNKITKLSCYADPLTESLLIEYKNKVESICSKELLPTYSFVRIYQPGEGLIPHTDRSSCEISVTINVDNMGELSPIYMQCDKDNPSEYFLNPGDAVVYKGCEIKHWRPNMKEGQKTVQFMLHYVDKNGLFAHYDKDTRPSYATGFHTRQGV